MPSFLVIALKSLKKKKKISLLFLKVGVKLSSASQGGGVSIVGLLFYLIRLKTSFAKAMRR